MDKIDKCLAHLSKPELRSLVKRANKLLARKRGRPEGSASKNPVTRASQLGAQYVRRLRNQFMKEQGVKRVPASFMDDAYDRAKEKHPDAKKSIMREHVRKQGQYRVRL
jgi:hypothetical protein